MMQRFARILYHCRLLGIFFLVVTTIILSFSIEIESDNSLRAWFAINDPDYIIYENYIDTFESGKYLIVALKSENLFVKTLRIVSFVSCEAESFAFVFVIKLKSKGIEAVTLASVSIVAEASVLSFISTILCSYQL